MTGVTDMESRIGDPYFQGGMGALGIDQMERVIDRGGVYILFRTAYNDSVAIGRYLGIYTLKEFVFFRIIHIVFFYSVRYGSHKKISACHRAGH